MDGSELREKMFSFKDVEKLNQPSLDFWHWCTEESGVGFEGGTDGFKRLLMFALVVMTNSKLIYETGMNAGIVPLYLAPALEHLDAKYVGFENYRPREVVLKHVQDAYPSRIEVVWGDCLVEVPKRVAVTGERPDFFHVDGPHGTPQAVVDIRNAVRAVKIGGIIMMDDATNPLLTGAIDQIPCVRERIIPISWGSGTSIFQVKEGDTNKLS